MATMHSKWGAELVGTDRDCLNLFNKLNSSTRSKDDYFVSKAYDSHAMRAGYILRTRKWDAARSAKEAEDLANIDLQVLVGCLVLLENCDTMAIGTIFEFDDTNSYFNRQRSSTLRILVYPADADLVHPIAFFNFVETVNSEVQLRIALSNLSAVPDWFSIYKCLEALKRHHGSENALLNSYSDRRSAISKVKRTANSFRHAPGVFEPVLDPATLDEAQALMRLLLRDAFAKHLKRRAALPSAFDIPEYETTDGTHIFLNQPYLGPTEDAP